MSAQEDGAWTIRPLEPAHDAALDRYIPSARGAGDEPLRGPGETALIESWRARTLVPGAIVRVLESCGEIHGLAAARPADLVIDGRPVSAFQIIEISVDQRGRGGGIGLARDMLARPHLFLGAANERVERLWRRVGGRRYRRVAPVRFLEMKPRRRIAGLGPARVLTAGESLVQSAPGRIHCRAAPPVAAGSDTGWLAVDNGAWLQWAIYPSTEGPMAVVRDLDLDSVDRPAVLSLFRSLGHLAKSKGATRILIPALDGQETADLLRFQFFSPATGWDPGPSLVLHDGSGAVDLETVGNPANWNLPRWLPL